MAFPHIDFNLGHYIVHRPRETGSLIGYLDFFLSFFSPPSFKITISENEFAVKIHVVLTVSCFPNRHSLLNSVKIVC